MTINQLAFLIAYIFLIPFAIWGVIILIALWLYAFETLRQFFIGAFGK